MTTPSSFNALSDDQVDAALRACLPVDRWVAEVAAGRPYDSRNALLHAAETAAAAEAQGGQDVPEEWLAAHAAATPEPSASQSATRRSPVPAPSRAASATNRSASRTMTRARGSSSRPAG